MSASPRLCRLDLDDLVPHRPEEADSFWLLRVRHIDLCVHASLRLSLVKTAVTC